MSSVVAGVGCALAQSGSADMSMRVCLGATPSNFTWPVNDEASAGLAGAADTRPGKENVRRAIAAIERERLFFIRPTFVIRFHAHWHRFLPTRALSDCSRCGCNG